MHWQYNLYTLSLLIAAVPLALLALFAWRRRPATGATTTALLLLATVIWVLGYALELWSADLPSKLFWVKFQCMGISIIPGAWLVLAFQCTGREKWPTRRTVALLTIEPLVVLLLVWTDPLRAKFYGDIELDTTGPLMVLSWTYGVGYWLDIVYSYVLISIGVFSLIRALVRSPSLYRRQVGALLVGAFAPLVAFALSPLDLNPFHPLDLTPFAFTLTGLATAWGLFRFQLFDIVPVARDAVIEGMTDGVIVLDAQNRIVDLNPAAQRIIGHSPSRAIGQPAARVLSSWPDLERYLDVTGAPSQIVLGEGEAQHIYDPRISLLHDPHGSLTGRLIVLRDVTERKRAEEALRRAHDELETRVQERTAELAQANEASRTEIAERKRAEAELEQRAAQLVLLNDIGGKIAAVMELDSVLDRTARLVQESFGYHHVALFTVDRERGELVMRTKAGSFVSLFPPNHRLELGQGMVGWVGLHGERLLANDVDAEPRYVNLYPDVIPTQSELSVPIRVGEEIVGVLDVQSPQPNAFDEDDVRVMETLADQIAIAIENARLYEAVQRELTERKRAEEALRKYAFIANTSKEFMTLIGKNHTYEATNESYCRAHNKTREEMLGRTVADVWGQEKYLTQIKEYLDECFAGNEVHYQAWFEFAALGRRCLDVTYYPYYDDAGTVTHTVVVSRDVTERKRAEDALQQAHAQNEQLLATIPSILIGVSPDDRITHWNAPAKTAFGIAATGVVERPFAECGIQWDWTEITRRIADCRNENRPAHLSDIRYTRPDGKDGFLNVAVNPFVGEEPGQSGFLLLGEEITERKILEMQLAQAQKLEAIGQLAAGIAHEINTPIQYVGDNTRFVQESFADVSNLLEKYRHLLKAAQAGPVPSELVVEVKNAVDDADVEYLSEEITSAIQESLEGIAHVTEIVRAMRGFSHPGVEEKTATDINDIVKGAITVARNEWKHIAEMETDFDTSLPLVPCLPGEFSQAILNVLVNAAHAIADVMRDGSGAKEPALSLSKGTIAVSTRQDGDWAEIRISDTGTGILKEVQPRIFDPFFTTKDVGKGTGQGLAIAHNVVVEKHSGVITFETEVGKGTTFIIRLPIENERESERSQK